MVIGSVVGAVAVALVIGVSAVWPGLDARDTPPVDTGVWALQTADGRRYARVNTAVGELDTVRNVENPSSLVQNSDDAYVISDSFSRVTQIDPAAPQDLDDETVSESPLTPAGTAEMSTIGDFVAYRTDAGAVYAGRLSTATTEQIDPRASEEKDEDTPDYAATALAVTTDGVVMSYSAAEKAVLRYSIPLGKALGSDPVSDVGEQPIMTAVGDDWFIFDTDNEQLWQRGVTEARTIETSGTAVLAKPMAEGDETYLADEGGLVRIPVSGEATERVLGGPDSDEGFPARPSAFEGVVYAAWLGGESGTLWRSGRGETPLDYGDSRLDDTRRASFVASGSTMILNETRTGWVWTMPDGVLIPSSQDWSIEDDVEQDAEPSEEQAEIVLEPKPPVAVDDAFGVRPGTVSSLAVMLNDHDPNLDVLSIDPSSVTGLDPAFGTAGVTDDGGRLAVTLAPGAEGTATLRYAVTDGTTSGGLMSKPATVTLTAKPAQENSAPVFCGVEKCLANWPEPQVRPGGSLTTAVLNGWVDPESDPVLVLSATVPEGKGAAAVTMTGDVVYQHSDPSLAAAEVVPVEVTIADGMGKTTSKVLQVTVTPTPELTATSFAELSSLGTDLTVDVAPHVSGTSGDVVLKSVQLMDAVDAEATISSGGTAFDFTAKAAGTYRVRYTVSDGVSEADATARVTLLAADAPAQLSTPPVVAFVRPQEDATVDVLAAVSNPTGRVLLVSDVSAVAAEGANLQVDPVGQNFVRVTGSTATDEPGRLGVVDYTVSDGSTDAGASVRGQATVYLLPPVSDLAPIASDDSLVVRAGAQIDIPVLANDVAPSGAALLLDPSTVRSSDDSALAFASGSQLRYLAPTKPGTYTVDYGVYAAGTPSVIASAKVRVTVIGDESNRAPRPKQLAGRVLSGQSTSIDFTQYGVDPDGDQVVLDRIMSQPVHGAASITPDGLAITYVSDPGSPGGQDTFTYRVTDSAGESRVGVARVGVLDEQSNPAPITFTDYVQVTVGQKEKAHLAPLDNDIDPTNGTLELSQVIPNIAQRLGDDSINPEYNRWNELLGDVSEDGVTITAGDTPGTMSYLYDVTSSSGNTARGLIIVKTVREIVQDYPVVSDTVLTSETRDQLANGVDVLTGRVAWTGGDASRLRLDLWDRADGISASGWSLRGDPGDDARIVPFAVEGQLSDGTDITTYAFLRVPAADDTTVSLRLNTAAFTVEERQSVDFDMRTIVVMPPDANLEVSADIATTGARAQATCTLTETSRVVYAAGEGAPWTDACVVPVRVKGQEDWTYLSVPIGVTALDPVPELKPASFTVIPGDSAGFDLLDMVSWQGREDWDNLTLAIDAPSGDITVRQEGSAVTAVAADSATPGREVAVTVSVTSHPDVTPARLMVRVGPAPSDLPRAGTVALECTQSQGRSCDVGVVGAPGESNPFPDTPLVLTSVEPSSTCGPVTFATNDNGRITASWPDGIPGMSCSVRFTLVDAQGRATNGDRSGTLAFRLKGFPQAPDAITQVGYGDGTVTLQVAPGGAQTSSPAVTGYVVTTAGGKSFTCDASGLCPFTRAANGEKVVYSVVAVNEVGSSKASKQVTAWAYAPPATPRSVKAKPVVTSDGKGGVVELTISGIDDAATENLLVQSEGAEPATLQVFSGRDSMTATYRVGSNTAVEVSVTPQTRFEVPAGSPTAPDGGATAGKAKTVMANGIGAPTGVTIAVDVERTSFKNSSVTVTAGATSGGDGSTTRYAIVRDGELCSDGSRSTTNTRRWPSLANNNEYTFTVCAFATSKDNEILYGTATPASKTERLTGGDAAPTGYTFTVDTTPQPIDNGVQWRITEAPKGQTPEGYTAVFSPETPSAIGRDPGISVRWISDKFGTSSKAGEVTPAEGSAPYQVAVYWSISCTVGKPIEIRTTSNSGDVDASRDVDVDGLRFLDEGGAELAPEDDTKPDVPPPGTVTVAGVDIAVGWGDIGWNLDSYVAMDISASCKPGN